ncbi:hypothetical protein ACN47A_04760 [Myxococcus fulvus]|uniref:hypothetical protein n=1 Tax=Myxococcus fulvus TaxID=33 RepID=UPI003B9C0C5B
MKRQTRLRQSEVRVRSGSTLVALLLLVWLGASFFAVDLVARFAGALALFFTAITAIEAWNVRRLRGQSPQGR